MCPVFMDVLLKNQPEGVQLSVKEVSLTHCTETIRNTFLRCLNEIPFHHHVSPCKYLSEIATKNNMTINDYMQP